MRLNILYPMFPEPSIGSKRVTNDPVNIDNVIRLTFDDQYFHDRRGFSKVYFHLVNGEKIEWIIPKKEDFQAQCDYIQEISISLVQISN